MGGANSRGTAALNDDAVATWSSRGPTYPDGLIKPDVIAPSNYVSTGRGFVEGTSIPGLMQLPPGYNIAGGTSTATPTTAGAGLEEIEFILRQRFNGELVLLDAKGDGQREQGGSCERHGTPKVRES